ncbi:MAG: family efflux transporter permease subunit [Frankiales bacterium]|nr:family efflux transporter permease subunit [Frankiales bacterium]
MTSAQRNVALLVAGAFFMENLDGTIIATAAPKMAQSLSVSSVDISVAITSYLLTLAVLIPASGWVSERWGPRRVFCVAIAIFTIASALCAASTSLPELAATRVLQGVGGAMMVPVGRLTVLRIIDKQDLIRAIAYLTWPALLAPVLAPALGGVIVTYASWRWIFLVNVPLGAMAIVLALRVIPPSTQLRPPRFDWLGLGLTASALASLLGAGELAQADRTDWVALAGLGAVGVALCGVATAYLGRVEHPVLDLRAMRIQTFRVAHAGGLVYRVTILAVPFLLPLMFQDGFGWSPVKAGLVVLFVFVGNIGIKPLTTPLLQRWGFRPVLIFAAWGAVLSQACFALLSGDMPLAAVLVLMTLSGAARSIGFTAFNTMAFADVESEAMTAANTLSSSLQQLAAGLGVAVGALALRVGGPISSSLGLSGSALTPYRVGFAVLAAISLIPVIEASRLPASAGQQLRRLNA